MEALLQAEAAGLLLLFLIGAGVGLLAGLLGIGGGAILVPALVVVLPQLGVPPAQVMNVALGTSLSCIVFTAASSTRAHHRRGAVRWELLAFIGPGVLIGSFAGALLTAALPTRALKLFFACFLIFVGQKMLRRPAAREARPIPGRLGLFAVGGGIGFVSGLLGIGGGGMSVPYLSSRVRLHEAIGSSAAIGLPIALSGSVGNIIGGWGAPGLPAGCLGFVYLPALAAVVLASALFAPLGVRLSHRLDVKLLRKLFGVLVLLISAKMLYGLLG